MSITQDLEALAALYDQGKLSADEYQRAKQAILASASAAASGSGFSAWLHRLHRSRSDVWLGGVCGGLANDTDVPSWMWRLIFTLLVCCAGTGVLVYLLLWVFLPAAPAFAAQRPSL